MLGLGINAGTYSFSPKLPAKDLRLFFAFDSGTAHFIRKFAGSTETIAIYVRTGQFRADRIVLTTVKQQPRFLKASIAGTKLDIGQSAINLSGNRAAVDFKPALAVNAGDALRIQIA
jgi:hypothetical protein